MTAVASETDRLADAYWQALLEADPLQATALGERGYDDRLPDVSPEGRAASIGRFEAILAGAAAAAEPSDAEERLTLACLRQSAAATLALLRADAHAYTVDVTWGLQTEFLSATTYQPLRDAEDGRAMVARWAAIAPLLDQMAANLWRGAGEGRTPIRASAERVVAQLTDLLDVPDEQGPLLQPVRSLPESSWTADDARRLSGELLEVVSGTVRPAVVRFRQFVIDAVLPQAREDDVAGIGNLPGGEEIYRSLVKAHTTTELEPDQIHEWGLREVERIDAETAELGARVLGAGTLREVHEALRGDPALHFENGEQIEEVARACLARAQAATPDWFGRLPVTPCEVARMLPHEEKHSTIAYYRPSAADGSRPGRYYINTWQPKTRPRYEAEALAFHEAVPGHHLQGALAQELSWLPAFRRHAGTTAYVEGWALYTERLANEMGLYSGETDLLGMLSFDSWRACRLVVDTGMHAMGWSRQEVIDFMSDHSALATNNIVNEVDRYLGRPGQALAYKIGQLEMLRLRAEAQDRLGAAFDIRRFHDAVLTHGALPLTTLAESLAADLLDSRSQS
jgi:uncharacterized protein (DUF885 family)